MINAFDSNKLFMELIERNSTVHEKIFSRRNY